MFRPIGNTPKVAQKQKELELKKDLEVTWEKTNAPVGITVKINGIINANVGRQRVLVWVSANGNRFAQAKNIVIHGNGITAEWEVERFSNASQYVAEIEYGNLKGKTETPLTIGGTASPTDNSRYASSFTAANPNAKKFNING